MLLALLVGLLLSLPVGLSAIPTAAADDSTEVTIQLTRLTPSIVRPDSTIVIQGRVTNVSKRSLVRLQAAIWRSLTPLTTQAQLQQANESAPTDPEGERMYSADTPDAYQDLYTAAHPELGPGQSRTFTVRATAADFFAPGSPQTGVYLAGIQVRENGVQTVGRARTLLPVSVGTLSADGLLPGQASIGSTTLVELTSTPSMSRPGVFVDDSLADEVAPGGRLDALLIAAEQHGASYAVDPDLIAELEAMRSGYKVTDSGGHTTAGTGASYAAAWLNRFRTMQADHDGFQILYADADLTAMVHAGRLDLIKRGQRAAAQVADTKGLPLLVTPADGVADRSALQAATELHARAVLLADTTVDGLGPVVRVPGGPLVLSYDTETAGGGPGPDPRDTEVQVRQASLSDSFITSISGRPSSSLGRLRVVTQAGEAGGESAALSAPWLSARSAYDLLNNTPAELQGDPLYPAGDAGQEPTHHQLDRITDLAQNLTTYQNLVVNSSGLADQADQAVARAISQAWRGQRRPMAAFVQSQQLLLRDTSGRSLSLSALTTGAAIRLDSSPQVTLTGSSAGVPVTIINNLDIPVRLQLLGQSPNQSRLRISNVPASKLGVNGVIGAGAKMPAQVPTRVDANGAMTVTLQLATPGGELIGPKHQLRVNATQAGMIGWIIAIASGIVLLGTVVLRIRQVARERGDQPDEDDDLDEDQPDQDQPDQDHQEHDRDHDLSPGVSHG
ncbi:hypothetical protein GCM10011575_31890 [Microlunatus endophyticus]|uniref:Secreted protein n=1 Tax=Microlunatus endophyticus TaxID=1716077 RepID=A0A917W769_9ACTN|nr:hypothetical protein GCM10011575_31890 [Microlunatus endophyticus]